VTGKAEGDFFGGGQGVRKLFAVLPLRLARDAKANNSVVAPASLEGEQLQAARVLSTDHHPRTTNRSNKGGHEREARQKQQ
jgi:hypothetical protein